MRIAQLAPLAESVPPKLYGGTERVASYLTEALVEMGHEVTLFASGDSRTSAELVSVCDHALRLDKTCREPLAYTIAMVERVWRMRTQFDVIHSHLDYLPMPLLSRQVTPCLTTMHGRLDWPELALIYREFRDLSAVSISEAQRTALPWMNWIGNVQHGLPVNLLRPSATSGNYLAFLGRVSPEKGPDKAIRVALRAGIPIKLAAKVDCADEPFFDSILRPMLDHPLVEFIGEIGEAQKAELLGQAAAVLFLIDWPEPFGMVMIEAMACGTPVIAFRRGAVPEIIEHGLTGFIVENEAAALTAIEQAMSLDRGRIRREFERRFTSRRMAEDYVRLYGGLVEPEDSSLVPAEG